jgi:hypothetical protein
MNNMNPATTEQQQVPLFAICFQANNSQSSSWTTWIPNQRFVSTVNKFRQKTLKGCQKANQSLIRLWKYQRGNQIKGQIHYQTTTTTTNQQSGDSKIEGERRNWNLPQIFTFFAATTTCFFNHYLLLDPTYQSFFENVTIVPSCCLLGISV